MTSWQPAMTLFVLQNLTGLVGGSVLKARDDIARVHGVIAGPRLGSAQLFDGVQDSPAARMGALVALDHRQVQLGQRAQPALDLLGAELAEPGNRQVLLPSDRPQDLLGHGAGLGHTP